MLRLRFLCLLVLAVVTQQTRAADTKKVVFVAGKPSHAYAAHEHYAGCMLLAKSLEQGMPNFRTEIFKNGWPDASLKAFEGADAIVMYCDGGPGHMANQHLDELDALAKKGVGIACIHYGVEVPKGKSGDAFLDWIGGYFEAHWSVNPHWTAKYEKFPDHPIARGVKPFEIHDEWYYHMRFRENMEGVTPILTAIPPESTLSRPDGPHSGNPHVRATKGQPQHMAWAVQRKDGGRGFGFTGGHDHWNWGDPNFRKVVLNAVVWISRDEVPKEGVSDKPVTLEDLEKNQDKEQPKNFDREAVRKRVNLSESDKKTGESGVNAASREASQAVAGLDVAEGLECTLFSSEPEISNITSIDIDHLGRVWACEVKNYRKWNNSRPEGDRILVLEDTNGDGKSDKTTVFYQGRDIDSAHGVCVLGNRVFVSANDKVQVFFDDDGDLKSDRKEVMFTGISGTQHDHGIHALIFGPDGKLYFNFGNSGNQIKDKNGKPIVDLAGNEVKANRKPYQEGMIFRCNLDGSEFETLGWNFRNNWEVATDSFGTIWQSDNDDDGNKGVRINYVMEFGNFGYKDEFTGAGWQAQRTNIEKEIPDRHWHLNDPGVIPNLLHTGAGSPTGICVYEGTLLPQVFHNQVIHCDAGPNVCRAYPATKDGAGYKAQTVNVLTGARDNWYRPSDVCVAPDGSLFVADWYDPGVGGHNQQEVDKGRIFRLAPSGAKYASPKHDFKTAAGAVEALKNPNLEVRYLAFTAILGMDQEVGPLMRAAYEQSQDNPRYQARLLWCAAAWLVKRGEKDALSRLLLEHFTTVENPDLRIVALRIAREQKLDVVVALVKQLVGDKSPEVRRECAIALRHNKSVETPAFWAQLADQHDGKDRWYLEALGIGADNNWDACLDAWLKSAGDKWNTPAGRDIIWRSRAKATPEYLAKILKDEKLAKEDQPRYFRAFDFLKGPEKEAALKSILGR